MHFYAVSGTDKAFATTTRAFLSKLKEVRDQVQRCISLCVWYAVPGTDVESVGARRGGCSTRARCIARRSTSKTEVWFRMLPEIKHTALPFSVQICKEWLRFSRVSYLTAQHSLLVQAYHAALLSPEAALAMSGHSKQWRDHFELVPLLLSVLITLLLLLFYGIPVGTIPPIAVRICPVLRPDSPVPDPNTDDVIGSGRFYTSANKPPSGTINLLRYDRATWRA
eukprot:3272298-Rhodomonas_salina.1